MDSSSIWNRLESCQDGKRAGLINKKLFDVFLDFRCWSEQHFRYLGRVKKILVHGKTLSTSYDAPHGEVNYRGPYTQIVYQNGSTQIERKEGQTTGINADIDGYYPGIRLGLDIAPYCLGESLQLVSTFFDLPQIKAEIVSTVGITLFIPINEDKFVRYRADQNSV
jgi:hypothetical protein